MRTVAICQPHYVPWIGYFEMVDRVDLFVLLDDVDHVQREWKSRNRIRKERRSAEAKWLSVPVRRECRRGTRLDRTLLDETTDWRRRHLDALREVYLRAPFYADAAALLEAGLGAPARTLAELNRGLLQLVCDWLGIRTPLVSAAELGAAGRKTDKLLAICRAVGADAYLANNGSAGYLEVERFTAAGLGCTFQDYAHPVYEQTSDGERLPFLSHLSVLDLVANQGPAALEVLRRGRPVHA